MAPNHMLRRRIDAVAFYLVLLGLVGSLRAQGITSSTPKSQPAATRTLSFPSSPCVGNLYLEPESGVGWNIEHVGLEGGWEYFSIARGDVRVPGNRNVILWVGLALNPADLARLRTQNPQALQMLVTDRTHAYANDLSGLSKLGPNDLHYLLVSSPMYHRTGVSPEVFASISRLTGLEVLGLHSSGITDDGLEHLRPLHSLKALELTQFSLGSRGLAVLKDLPALEYLSLNTNVTDDGLKQVAQLSHLRWLQIVDGKMWGPGLAELARLPRLERLCIQHSRGQLFDQHIKYLEGLTHLKGLTLWSGGCDTLTDASLASIGRLTALEERYFIWTSPKFTPAGVAHLQNLKNLKKVDFGAIWAGRPGELYGDEVARQLAAMPDLESIEQIGYLSPEGMKALAALRNLKSLHIALKDRHQGYYGPTGLSHIAGLRSVEKLAIDSGDRLSDVDLAELETLDRLKDLLIVSPGVSDRGLASIGKLKQLERLDVKAGIRGGLNHLNNLSNLQYLNVTAWGDIAKTAPAEELMLDLSGLAKLKDFRLFGLPLHDDDLAFLRHLPLLETLMIEPSSSLTGASLRHLRQLPELHLLWVLGLSNCTGQDLTYLSNLQNLRELRIAGDITDAALALLAGPPCLNSLMVETDDPIRQETVTDLTKSHPGIEYIHINALPRIQTKPVGPRTHPGVGQPRPDRPTPADPRR